MLAGVGLEGARVLDLYAGTGALGIEALSRGAAWADLVERSPAQCRLIRRNLEAAGLKQQARVWCMTVERGLGVLNGPYDFILADPPYGQGGVEAMLARLGGGAWLSAEGVLILEHSRHDELAEEYGSLRLWRRRRHGDSCLSLYRGDGPCW